jgi:hypothetical protein
MSRCLLTCLRRTVHEPGPFISACLRVWSSQCALRRIPRVAAPGERAGDFSQAGGASRRVERAKKSPMAERVAAGKVWAMATWRGGGWRGGGGGEGGGGENQNGGKDGGYSGSRLMVVRAATGAGTRTRRWRGQRQRRALGGKPSSREAARRRARSESDGELSAPARPCSQPPP